MQAIAHLDSLFFFPLDMDVRGRLATINHRLTSLERQVEYAENSLAGFGQRTVAVDQGDAADEPETA